MAKKASRETSGPPKAVDGPMNRSLHAAKAAKQDEFYTQYVDIQKEVEAYLEFDPDTFRGKVVYCNCDDPFESNFFKYFAANFNKLGLKKLITTSYDGSPIAGAGTSCSRNTTRAMASAKSPRRSPSSIDEVKDEDGDGASGHRRRQALPEAEQGRHDPASALDEYPGGDFRSPECVAAPETGGHRRHQPALLPLPRVRRPARGARQEVPDHRQSRRDHLQGDLPAHQGQQAVAGGHDPQWRPWFRVPDHYPTERGRLACRRERRQVHPSQGRSLVHKPGPWPPPPEAAAHDHGGQPEVQQAQGDQGQGGLRPVRQLRRHRSALHRCDPQRLRRHHGRPDHLPRQVQPRPVRDSWEPASLT